MGGQEVGWWQGLIPRLVAGTAGCMGHAFPQDSLGGVKTWENVSLRHPRGGVRVVDVQVCTSEQETGPEDCTFGNW